MCPQIAIAIVCSKKKGGEETITYTNEYAQLYPNASLPTLVELKGLAPHTTTAIMVLATPAAAAPPSASPPAPSATIIVNFTIVPAVTAISAWRLQLRASALVFRSQWE